MKDLNNSKISKISKQLVISEDATKHLLNKLPKEVYINLVNRCNANTIAWVITHLKETV